MLPVHLNSACAKNSDKEWLWKTFELNKRGERERERQGWRCLRALPPVLMLSNTCGLRAQVGQGAPSPSRALEKLWQEGIFPADG